MTAARWTDARVLARSFRDFYDARDVAAGSGVVGARVAEAEPGRFIIESAGPGGAPRWLAVDDPVMIEANETARLRAELRRDGWTEEALRAGERGEPLPAQPMRYPQHLTEGDRS